MTSKMRTLVLGIVTPSARWMRGAAIAALLAVAGVPRAVHAQQRDSTSKPATQAAKPAAQAAQPAAQAAPAGWGTLSGFVMDSLHHRPLVGATVLLAGTMHSAVTDESGRYHMDSVEAGRYQIGFLHPLLDSLGLGLPPRTITVRSNTPIEIDLGVPSVNTIQAAVCPDSARGTDAGMIAGVVRDADSRKPLPGAIVVLSWMGYRVTGGRLFKMLQAMNAKADQNGAYWVCGIPTGTTITVRATSGEHSSGQAELELGSHELALRDISLVSTTPPATAAGAAAITEVGGVARSGTAILVGTVTSKDGTPLEHAQANVLGTTATGMTDAKGVFRLTGLPPGTQTVEVRMIGFLPRRATVDLRSQQTTRVSVVLQERVVVLDSVKVFGKKTASSDWLDGFDKRRKRGFGHFLTRADIEKRSPIELTDAFRGIPGVQVNWTGDDYVLSMTRSVSLSGSCPISYYLDGSPLDNFNINEIQPSDVEAIEIYQAGEAPVQYSGGMTAGCGTVVIWTRRPGVNSDSTR